MHKRNTSNEWSLNYTPRPQMAPFHQRDKRFAYLICHRRFGKTVACVAELIIRAIYTKKKNAQYAYVCPFRSQAKAVAWNYLVDMTEGIATDIRVSDLSVTLPNGAKIFLTGSDNVNALRGLYLDGCVLDEFAQCRPDLLQAVIMPCLLDRLGWLVIIGTAYGRLNQFYEYYEKSRTSDDWFHADIKVSESGVIPATEIERIKRSVSEAKFNQEFMNDFSAELVGTYFAAIINRIEANGQICKETLYDPNVPVHAAFDIGRGDSTVAWFWQERPDGFAIIDHYANNGEGADHYIAMLKDKKYDYERIWLPHDARAKTFATKKSAVEQFMEAKLPVSITPRLSVEDGIEAARQVLPQCRFDYERCYEGVEALRVYRKQWNEMHQVFSDKPLHDFACFAAGTLVDTPIGRAPIESLQTGHYVSVGGISVEVEAVHSRVLPTLRLHFDDGSSVQTTAEHKFFTIKGLLPAGDLVYGDAIYTAAEAVKWSASEKGIRGAFTESFLEINTAFGQNANGMLARKANSSGCYIGSYGSGIMGIYLTNILSRLKTGIGRILPLITGMFNPRDRKAFSLNLSTPTSPSAINGITETLERGTTTTPLAVQGGKQCSTAIRSSTTTEVSQTGIVSTISTTTRPTTTSAISSPSRWQSILDTTLNNLGGWVARRISNKLKPSNTKRLLRVERCEERQVFDLSIPHHHAYVANGCLVSNSDHADAFRYLAIVARPKLSTAMKVARATANADTPKSTYTLDALFRDREAAKSRGIAKLRI